MQPVGQTTLKWRNSGEFQTGKADGEVAELTRVPTGENPMTEGLRFREREHQGGIFEVAMAARIVSSVAFDEVLESCRRFLLVVANAELPADLRAKGGASDLVQQTLAAAVRSEHQFRGTSVRELRAWLRAILKAEVAAFRRRYSGTAARDVGREVAWDESVLAAGETPVQEVIEAERQRHLAMAVEHLPPDSRQAIVWRMEESLGFAEIGKRLGRSEDAARKLFHRALQELRQQLVDLADPCP